MYLRGQFSIRAVIALAFLTCSPTAYGRETSDWLKCDGFPKPGAEARQAAAATGALLTLGLSGIFGSPEYRLTRPAAHGADGVAACSNVLTSPQVANQPVRRVQLLRARAMHHLENGDSASVLSDIAQADALHADFSESEILTVSSSVQAGLIEALALARLGRHLEASERAGAAADLRPHSFHVQRLAAQIMRLDPFLDEHKERVFKRLIQFSPMMRYSYAEMLDWTGDIEAAADEWDRYIAARTEQMQQSDRQEKASVPGLISAALAAARAGRIERSTELLSQANTEAERQSTAGAEIAPATRRYLREQTPGVLFVSLVAQRDFAAAANVKVEGLEGRPAVYEALAHFRNEAWEVEEARENERDNRLLEITNAAFVASLPNVELNPYSGYARMKNLGKKPNSLRPDEKEIVFVDSRAPLPAIDEMAMLNAATQTQLSGATHFIIMSHVSLTSNEARRIAATQSTGVYDSGPNGGMVVFSFMPVANSSAIPKDAETRMISASDVINDLHARYMPTTTSQSTR